MMTSHSHSQNPKEAPLSRSCPQVAKAVNNATEHSLVLIDEFGKGTNSVRRREENEAKERGWRKTRDGSRRLSSRKEGGREARAGTEGHKPWPCPLTSAL